MNPTLARELQRNAARGNSRAAGTYACPGCRAVILRGLDADVAALTVTVDPAPLTLLGEVLALARGRTTYDLTRRGGRYELDPRNPSHIKKRPASEFHVAPEHKCGNPLPAKPREFIPANTPVSDECGY